MVKNIYDEKEYRVSRESSTQGIYFETDKGDNFAEVEGKKLWVNKYGKADDIYVQRWDKKDKTILTPYGYSKKKIEVSREKSNSGVEVSYKPVNYVREKK